MKSEPGREMTVRQAARLGTADRLVPGPARIRSSRGPGLQLARAAAVSSCGGSGLRGEGDETALNPRPVGFWSISAARALPIRITGGLVRFQLPTGSEFIGGNNEFGSGSKALNLMRTV